MPTITLNIDVTNAELARVIPAVKAHLGLPEGASNATVQTEFRNLVRRQLIGIVKDFEQKAAATAAADAVTEIAPT